MPFREKRPDERVFRQLVPLSRPVCRADWRKNARLSPTAPEFTAETDSPLEGAGFEPSVPLAKEGRVQAWNSSLEVTRRLLRA